MKAKKSVWAVLWAAMLAMICLSACSKPAGSPGSTVPAESSVSSSEESSSVYAVLSFPTLEEFEAYLTDPSKWGNSGPLPGKGVEGDTVRVYIPAVDELGGTLNRVVINPSMVCFYYSLYPAEEPRKKSSSPSTPNEVTSIPDEEANALQEKIDQAGGYENYLREHPEENPDTQLLSGEFNLAWFPYGGGEDSLKSLISRSSGTILESSEYPGVYCKGADLSGDEEVKGCMVYWLQDGYLFDAYVPAEKLEQFLPKASEWMKPVEYTVQ